MGAHDTTFTGDALARIFYLPLNLEVQSTPRQGMIEARAQGDLAYDALMALPHLDAVVRESIRLCQVHGTATNRIVPSFFFSNRFNFLNTK